MKVRLAETTPRTLVRPSTTAPVDVIVPVAGVETPEPVQQLARLAQRPPKLGPRDFEKIAKIRRTIGTTFCRACRYCEPCPQGILIYHVLYLPIYVKQVGGKKFLGKTMPTWLRQAEQCTACRACEKRCPFHLHIVEGLKQSLALGRKVISRRSTAAAKRRK